MEPQLEFFPGGCPATHRSGGQRGGARNRTGDAPQRPPTWRHPPGGEGKRPPRDGRDRRRAAAAATPPRQQALLNLEQAPRPPSPRHSLQLCGNAAGTPRYSPRHASAAAAVGARARTLPRARTAHRANGAGRDGGRTGVAARTAGDGR